MFDFKFGLKAGMAAALMSAALAGAAFAATGWVADGNIWRYYDRSGNMVYDEWKKSGDNWYWLNSDGEMETNALIEDGNNFYYVDQNGAMVRNTWVAVPAEDLEDDYEIDYRWYFFANNGKAIRDKEKYRIGAHRYGFDSDGRMLFGWVSNGEIWIGDQAPLEADHYYGSNDDGAMRTGWVLYNDVFLPDKFDHDEVTDVWFYFNSKGVKLDAQNTPNGKKINGQTYRFDENGIMYGQWGEATKSNGGKSAQYFSGYNDGHLAKKSWFTAVPSEELSATDYENGTKRTFYVDAGGNTVVNEVRKIDGKWYAFDKIGRRSTGLKAIINKDGASMKGARLRSTSNLTGWNASSVMGLDPDKGYYVAYFTKTGALLKANKSFELKDGKYSFRFDNHGLGINGLDHNKLYVNGILQQTGNDIDDNDYRNYQLRYNLHGKPGEYAAYIVDKNGNTIRRSGSYKDNGIDFYMGVHFNDDDSFSVVWIDMKNSDASKAAKEFANTGSLGEYAGEADVWYSNTVSKIVDKFDESLVTDDLEDMTSEVTSDEEGDEDDDVEEEN